MEIPRPGKERLLLDSYKKFKKKKKNKKNKSLSGPQEQRQMMEQV